MYINIKSNEAQIGESLLNRIAFSIKNKKVFDQRVGVTVSNINAQEQTIGYFAGCGMLNLNELKTKIKKKLNVVLLAV